MWSHGLASACGVAVPLHAAEHFYIVTEPITGLPGNLPVLRVQDECAYYKEDAGKLLVGCFEPVAKPWGMRGIPEDFSFETLPEDYDHFEPILNAAVKRVPALADAGIQLFFNGPESFTPDDRLLHRRSSRSARPVRRHRLQLDRHRRPAAAPARSWRNGSSIVGRRWTSRTSTSAASMPFQAQSPLPARSHRRDAGPAVRHALAVLPVPDRARRAAHALARPPGRGRRLHGRDGGLGAAQLVCAARVQRPATTIPTAGRTGSMPARSECLAVRDAVALFDQCCFAKFLVQGADACAILNHLSTADVDVAPGRIVYTQWLNDRGGIEADLTITRLAAR